MSKKTTATPSIGLRDKSMNIKINDEEERMIRAGAKHMGIGISSFAKMTMREHCIKHKLEW